MSRRRGAPPRFSRFPPMLESARRAVWVRQMRRRVGIGQFAAFGENSVIIPPARVENPHRISVGRDVLVQERAVFSVVESHHGKPFSPRLTIGDRTVIGRDFCVANVGEIDIGPDVLMADGVFIGDTYHDYHDPARPVLAQPMVDPEPVRIEAGAFLGVRAIVLAGVTVGANAVVGAGAVVTRDVPPRSVVAGNPARVIREWDEARGEWVRRAPDGRT
jgi:acetyltransferase-like isoleucine patch superfamily enzyme